MTVVVRGIAVLTVLLGLALMAVSAYAATMEPEGGWGVGGFGGHGGGFPSQEEEEAAMATAVAEATATAASATPTPTVALRYAAPARALPVTRTGSRRANLSPGPRIWRFPSFRPSAANFSGLAEGGLEIPLDQLAVMQQVAGWSGLPWQIFAAIAKVESNLGRNMSTSSAGAIGYGQFLPETWALFGNGGDPYDFRDVIPAMGRFLLAAGAPDDMAGALYAYNHSWSYVAQVLSVAVAYGYRGPGTGQPVGESDGLIWPVVGPISSYFSPGHPAIDIDQTATPGAPVRAAHDGVVLFAGGDPCCSYGRYVMVVSPSGLLTLYAHLDSLAVSPGQTVHQGDSLGPAGCTGYCTGVHLHFEVIEGGARRDPLQYLP